jgi:hypothetical protein
LLAGEGVKADYPAEFRREQGFTEAEWLRCLPGGTAGHVLTLDGPGRATVQVGDGRLHLAWQVMPPRQIALLRWPVLAVHFRFDGVADDQRQAFMRYFDLYTQRGGG